MISLYLLQATLLVAIVTSQTFETDMGQDTTRSSVAASLMNITFSEPSTADCGQNSSDSLMIAIRTVPEKTTCFNLEDTFTNPERTYSTRGYGCQGGDLCGVNYTVISEASVFNDNANYSQIFYTQVRNPFVAREQSNSTADDDETGTGGRLVFETYNAANCKQDRKTDNKLPFYRWNCNSEQGECDAVPFGVKSFTISMMDPEDVGDSDCTLAQEGGAGETVQVNGFAALAAAFLGIAFLV